MRWESPGTRLFDGFAVVLNDESHPSSCGRCRCRRRVRMVRITTCRPRRRVFGRSWLRYRSHFCTSRAVSGRVPRCTAIPSASFPVSIDLQNHRERTCCHCMHALPSGPTPVAIPRLMANKPVNPTAGPSRSWQPGDQMNREQTITARAAPDHPAAYAQR